jgi:hypothetical protein
VWVSNGSWFVSALGRHHSYSRSLLIVPSSTNAASVIKSALIHFYTTTSLPSTAINDLRREIRHHYDYLAIYNVSDGRLIDGFVWLGAQGIWSVPDFTSGVPVSSRLSSPRYPGFLNIFLAFSNPPFTDSGLCRGRFYNIPLALRYVEGLAIRPALCTICIPGLMIGLGNIRREFRVRESGTTKH